MVETKALKLAGGYEETITPRPLPIAIAAILAAVAMPGTFSLVMLTTNGFRVSDTPAAD